MHEGADGVSDPVRPRPGGAKRQGVPLSSVTKGFAAGKKHPAVRALLLSFFSLLSLMAEFCLKERLEHVTYPP